MVAEDTMHRAALLLTSLCAACSGGAAAPDAGPPPDAFTEVPDTGPLRRRIIWASDWSTELGTSRAAETDGDRWDIYADPGDGFEVVPGNPLGFPIATALSVTAVESAGGYARLAVTGLGVPAIGESRWYRWYVRSEIPRTGDNVTHPIETGGLMSDLDWSWNVQIETDTTWRAYMAPGGDEMDRDRARWIGPVLDRGVVYRFELQIEKVSDTEFHAHIRVYDAAGTLLYDDDDFDNFSSGIGPSMPMTLADEPTLHFAEVGGTSLDAFRAGINSLVDTGYGRILYAYQAGFAVCADDWCGPHVPGEGR
jgi:hypothetical protein